MNKSKFLYLDNKNSYSMNMYTQIGNDLREINDFVNKNGIKKEQIVQIFQENDGLFVILYYAD